ncbi:MAG: hypothetical protein MZU97_14520 [Bacillus subtilis]|nr:hypothetical protein [Bacillus subtilis]
MMLAGNERSVLIARKMAIWLGVKLTLDLQHQRQHRIDERPHGGDDPAEEENIDFFLEPFVLREQFHADHPIHIGSIIQEKPASRSKKW